MIFTAHSIPVSMAEGCQECRYEEEFRCSSRLVAEKVGLKQWACAYHSKSGNPADPWLGPDVAQSIQELGRAGRKQVLLVPLGFLCDNAEILYDLDVEAKAAAEKAGVRYFRAATVMDHPSITQMFGQFIESQMQTHSKTGGVS